MRSVKKKRVKEICAWFRERSRSFFYLVLVVMGSGLTLLSFRVVGNWASILSGVGTGLLTSFVVSYVVTKESDMKNKRKLEEDKKFILNDIVSVSTEVYIELIFRINEYILFAGSDVGEVYQLYNSFEQYNVFESKLKNNMRKTIVNKVYLKDYLILVNIIQMG